ncbi:MULTISPECIES: DUF362 domain-containing protein [Pelosinus]|uniref:4Fe-4S ferredoxin-type domain-containing protein n=1 Tax=Pelosinus fermentans B4 TaxID=1149862 RepID=I9LAX1_9FIRM|nr:MULTISPECIES: DUF362 domain-containing protein [Pelosinus]EIW17461.1 protein of unknown function DUF362 [Pelosinus fermentans B4]EIW23521.1 protein of unknown function DUF362 [Pelosinus fermentans A11]
MEIVSIAQAKSYKQEEVEKAVYDCLDGIPGIKGRLKNGARVLVKVNLLKKNAPEDAVTTHPAVVEAIVRYLQGLGCSVIIGDSPGGPYNVKRLISIYKATGMTQVSENTGCELNYDTSAVAILNEKAQKLKQMQIIKIAEEVDFIVSAAKFKTHGMMLYTGGVKNLFGVIPGLTKAEYHFKMNNAENFAHHLVDICEYIKPVFTIIDAIEGMEGDGPSAGEKRQVGLLLASENPYALDTVGAHIMGMRPLQVPTVKVAKERGLFSGELKELSVRGLQLEDIHIPPFKLPGSLGKSLVSGKVPQFVEEFLINALRAQPVFNYNRCISCGECARGCPAKIIDMSSGKPILDLNKCISCFCCHELCPKKAVTIKKHWLHRLLFR